MRLFVYYTVDRDRRRDVVERLAALGRTLGTQAPRVMRRDDEAASIDTWLECYDDVDAPFEATLAALVERDGLAALTGPRHVERFVDVAGDVAMEST